MTSPETSVSAPEISEWDVTVLESLFLNGDTRTPFNFAERDEVLLKALTVLRSLVSDGTHVSIERNDAEWLAYLTEERIARLEDDLRFASSSPDLSGTFEITRELDTASRIHRRLSGEPKQ
jgi:hypothetical protein